MFKGEVKKNNWRNSSHQLIPITLSTTHIAGQVANSESVEHTSVHTDSFIAASQVRLVVLLIFILHKNIKLLMKISQLDEGKLFILMV